MPYSEYKKIDTIIQFALLCAGHNEEWTQRELGAIHLIKYVYLADYHYALAHGGNTYTNLKWRFYKFGPWEETCFLRIEPALEAIGAEKRTVSHPKYEDDFVRWLCSDPELHDELQDQLPIEIVGYLEKYIREFGSDTERLLDFVYKTPPILKVSPNELLIFEGLQKQEEISQESVAQGLTRRQEKKLKEKFEYRRLEVRKRLDQKRNRKSKRFRPPEPRYDEVYYEGVAQLDRLAGEAFSTQDCLIEVAADAWKSEARFDPDLS